MQDRFSARHPDSAFLIADFLATMSIIR